MKAYSRAYAKVDLDAVIYNLEQMKKNLPGETQIMAVIKTDGYGHGALPIAKKLMDIEYVRGFAVATAEEAFSLRRHGINKMILMLGAVFEDQLEELIDNEIRMTIFQVELAEKIQRIAEKKGRKAYLHVKLDTAMSRLGINPNCEESEEIVKKIAEFSNIELEGIFTHFSKSDEADKSNSHRQMEDYVRFVEKMKECGITFSIHHCANSAAIIDLPQYAFDMVRAGIILYGMYPSEEVDKRAVDLKPVMSLHSRVVYIKNIAAGTSVSYGGTYTADRTTRVATIPVGYGDGYPRLLSNKGMVLIHRQEAPIIGRVCMDQFMVDITDIPEVSEGDEVLLFGTDGEKSLPIERLCDLCGRFNYEFVCDIGRRIPRVYVSGGKIVGNKDWFDE